MIWPDLAGRTVLVTGGTRGLGLGVGVALGRRGANVWLTHRWGSVPDAEVLEAFAAVGAPTPRIVEADVGDPDDTARIVDAIAGEHASIDLFVSNACVAGRGGSLESLRRRDFARCLHYGAWPLLRYVEAIEARLGAPPRRVVAMSSDGVNAHLPGYDYVALAKAVLESIAAAMPHTFVLRTRQATTGGYVEIFPEHARRLLQRFDAFAVTPADVGDAVAAIASGFLDGLRGRVITIDRGSSRLDNTMTAATLLAEMGA